MTPWKRWEREYRFLLRPWPIHIWIVIGPRAALHLHISEPESVRDVPATGGIETHWRYPPACMEDQSPSHSPCSILHSPCWHEGSSLAATEIWIPRWEADPHDHRGMLDALGYELFKVSREGVRVPGERP